MSAATQAQTGAAAQSPTRDAASVQLLTNALQKAGGQSAWQALHGSRVSGTLTTLTLRSGATVTVSHHFEWLDDWSTGKPRFVRALKTPTGYHAVRHNDQGQNTALLKGKQIIISPFDRANVLLTHLPAAALSIVLNDSRKYSITPSPRLSTSSENAIAVESVDGTASQVWLLSKTSGQADAVQFSVPDAVSPSRRAWEKAIYQNYTKDGGVTRPSDVLLVRPTGQGIQIHLDHFDQNPSVLATDFTSEAVQ